MCDELRNELKEAINLVKQCLEQTDKILDTLIVLTTPKAGVTNCEHLQAHLQEHNGLDQINIDIIKEGINFTWDKPLSKEMTDIINLKDETLNKDYFKDAV